MRDEKGDHHEFNRVSLSSVIVLLWWSYVKTLPRQRRWVMTVHGISSRSVCETENRLEGVNRRNLKFTNFKHNYKPGLALE
jgi:hypothetical protein